MRFLRGGRRSSGLSGWIRMWSRWWWSILWVLVGGIGRGMDDFMTSTCSLIDIIHGHITIEH